MERIEGKGPLRLLRESQFEKPLGSCPAKNPAIGTHFCFECKSQSNADRTRLKRFQSRGILRLRCERPDGESRRRENLNQPHNAAMAVLTEVSDAAVATGVASLQG
jgi:hypothetical protein